MKIKKLSRETFPRDHELRVTLESEEEATMLARAREELYASDINEDKFTDVERVFLIGVIDRLHAAVLGGEL